MYLYLFTQIIVTSGTNTNVENEILQWIWACLGKS